MVADNEEDEKGNNFIIMGTDMLMLNIVTDGKRRALCFRIVILQCTSGAVCLNLDLQWWLRASDVITQTNTMCYVEEITMHTKHAT